jgi:hypothetical protein
VQYQKCKKTNLDSTYQEIGPHEMCSFCKLFTAVVPEYLCIDITMDNQEQDQEQTGQAHLELFADRSAEIIFPGHIRIENFVE